MGLKTLTGVENRERRSKPVLHQLLISCLAMGFFGSFSGELASAQDLPALEASGAQIFRNDAGTVIEVQANHLVIDLKHIKELGTLQHLTDLSLEGARFSDADMAKLSVLPKLEWLNLWNTETGDLTCKTLAKFPSLQELPIGGTLITDKGLASIYNLKQLTYLGLRNNQGISNAGLPLLKTLPQLEGLYLGGTSVTDKGIQHLPDLPALKKLWLGKRNHRRGDP